MIERYFIGEDEKSIHRYFQYKDNYGVIDIIDHGAFYNIDRYNEKNFCERKLKFFTYNEKYPHLKGFYKEITKEKYNQIISEDYIFKYKNNKPQEKIYPYFNNYIESHSGIIGFFMGVIFTFIYVFISK